MFGSFSPKLPTLAKSCCSGGYQGRVLGESRDMLGLWGKIGDKKGIFGVKTRDAFDFLSFILIQRLRASAVWATRFSKLTSKKAFLLFLGKFSHSQ